MLQGLAEAAVQHSPMIEFPSEYLQLEGSESEIHTHNTELQPDFSVTEYFCMIIICGFVPAGCSAEACVGVGKRSSPQQADGAAGSQ